MNRFNPRWGRWVAACTLMSTLLAAAGCMGPVLTAMYLAGGADTPADFKGLQKKTVAVVCRPMVQLKYRNMSASKQISREVSKLLQQRARATVIDHDKVAEWLDNNNSEEYLEVGRALGADMVLGIDLLDFDIYQGQTLYQGKAAYALKVYDCATGELVYEKMPDPAVWPPNAGIPTSEKQESQFRRKFVAVLADEIGRHFFSHDARMHFAGDAAALD